MAGRMTKKEKTLAERLNDLYEFAPDDLNDFLEAPRKAQELFFVGVALLGNPDIHSPVPQILNGMSPIECIFDIAMSVYRISLDEPDYYFYLEDQHDIYIGEKHYIADFYVEKANLIIECDGHDYHQKTKEQVIRDNEREYDLKMAGYNILRFSGSQIYNHPFECAEEAYLYITKLIQEKKGENK